MVLGNIANLSSRIAGQNAAYSADPTFASPTSISDMNFRSAANKNNSKIGEYGTLGRKVNTRVNVTNSKFTRNITAQDFKDLATQTKNNANAIEGVKVATEKQTQISGEILKVLKAIKQSNDTAMRSLKANQREQAKNSKQQRKNKQEPEENAVSQKVKAASSGVARILSKLSPIGRALSIAGRVLGYGAAAGAAGYAGYSFLTEQNMGANPQPGVLPYQPGPNVGPMSPSGESRSVVPGRSLMDRALGRRSSVASSTPDASPSQTTGDLPLDIMSNVVAVGETGQKGFGKQLQIAPDTSGSSSYGILGINSGSGSAATFARMFPELNLQGRPGSPEFNASWKREAESNPQRLIEAQKKYFEQQYLPHVRAGLQKAGLPPEMINDPRVLGYFGDRAVQQGPPSISRDAEHIGRAWQQSNGNVNQFFNNFNQNEREHLPSRFRRAYGEGRYTERGNETRLERRTQGALGLGSTEEYNERARRERKQPSNDAELNRQNTTRPDYMRGTLRFDDQTYNYGSGAPGATGADMQRGSVPYGTFNIKPGLHFGANPRFAGNSFRVEDMFDPKWGKKRSHILFHSARDLDKLYSAGCFAIDPRQWPRFRAQMLKAMKEHGELVVRVNPDGSAEIKPKKDMPNATPSSQNPVTAEQFVERGLKQQNQENNTSNSNSSRSSSQEQRSVEQDMLGRARRETLLPQATPMPSTPPAAAPYIDQQARDKEAAPTPQPQAQPVPTPSTPTPTQESPKTEAPKEINWTPGVMNYWKQGNQGVHV